MTDDGDVRWDPENEEFIEDVVLWGVAAWTVGVAVLVAFLIYFMVRCICWICLNDVRPCLRLSFLHLIPAIPSCQALLPRSCFQTALPS